MPLPRFAKLPPERRRTILDAALSEFAERGYESASLNRILARTGVSKGAAYYYFADKEDLYLTVLEDALAELGAHAPELGPVTSARAFWRAAARIYEQMGAVLASRSAVLRLLRRDADRVTALASSERLGPLVQQARGWMEELVAEGRRVGALRDDLPEALVVELVFAVGEAADRYMIASGEIETDEGRRRAIARSMDLLERMLRP